MLFHVQSINSWESSLWLLLIKEHVRVFCLHVCLRIMLHDCWPWRPEVEGRNLRWLWVAMWVMRTESISSESVANTPKDQLIYSLLQILSHYIETIQGSLPSGQASHYFWSRIAVFEATKLWSSSLGKDEDNSIGKENKS